jgi:signal transduction histidine kinase
MSSWLSRRVAIRRRSRPEAVIERFTARLGPPIPAEELLLQLAEALKASLRAARAEVWLLDGDRLERSVSVPHLGEGDSFVLAGRELAQLAKPNVSGRSWAEVWMPALLNDRTECSLRVASVVNEGEPLGLLVVERPADSDFRGDEEAVLAELARHLGLSLRNERLRAQLEATLDEVRQANDELRRSRARVVETADAERRRIERDLHDGAQQQLIALSIELRRARQALEGDSAASASIERAGAALDAAIEDLADLAHGIYPPILSASGLEAALRVVVRRHPSEVRLEITELGRQPAAIETAIYFVVLEALQNAAKHAPGARVAVSLAERHDAVELEVADDGPGFEVDRARRGHGMLNIGDRVGAIGGTVRWESSPGSGTRIRGVVPKPGRGSGG